MLDRVSVAGQLGQVFGERCVAPGDARYDAMRAVAIAGLDKCPAAIVRVRDAEDIARVVAFARERGVELAVRSGGHSVVGHSGTEGGIVIDLRDMSAISVDADARTAWVETGATAGMVARALEADGFVVGFGDSGSVGVGGITVGGGIGFLVRKFGLTIDSVLAAEVVTADGRIVYTDHMAEPDLFWAIRGGGGNFGVVARVKFRLHRLPGFTGGMLVLPATAEALAGIVAAAEAAPEEVSAIVNLMPAPPMPFLPPEAHGKPVIMAMLAFAGPDAEAEEALRPFRAVATPLADTVKPSAYADMLPPEEGPAPGIRIEHLFIERFGADEAAIVVDRVKRSTAVMSITQIRVLGGAAARVAPGETAFAHRDSRIMVNMVAFTTGPDDAAVQTNWLAEFKAAMRQKDAGAYVNFLGGSTAADLHAAYPDAHWKKLRAIKRRYDPANLFRLNQNIPPE
jgi:FAD/FMN-containing dehydrogenase